MNLNQSYGAGGSTNSSQSISNTAGVAASQMSQQVTSGTNATAQQAWREAAEYNSREAQIAREWQERMANSVYQRTVADMKKAGINPVLAAGMGLGTASVGGGSAASISPSQVFNAQTFPESNSASQSYGSSWNNSESGLITLANALAGFGSALAGSIASGQQIDIAINGLEKILGDTDKNNNGTPLDDSITGLGSVLKGTRKITSWIKDELNPLNSGLIQNWKHNQENIERYKNGQKMKGWYEY